MDAFLSLGTHGWQIRPNLHFAFMSTNLFWAETKLPIREYLEYWLGNKKMICQVRRGTSGFYDLFKNLLTDGLISSRDVQQLEDLFTNTNRKSVNVCPGIGLTYFWKKADAQTLDGQGQFADAVLKKIEEALQTFGDQFENAISR